MQVLPIGSEGLNGNRNIDMLAGDMVAVVVVLNFGDAASVVGG
jgi:hypothetical protein